MYNNKLEGMNHNTFRDNIQVWFEGTAMEWSWVCICTSWVLCQDVASQCLCCLFNINPPGSGGLEQPTKAGLPHQMKIQWECGCYSASLYYNLYLLFVLTCRCWEIKDWLSESIDNLKSLWTILKGTDWRKAIIQLKGRSNLHTVLAASFLHLFNTGNL